jgi:hypothetical protein
MNVEQSTKKPCKKEKQQSTVLLFLPFSTCNGFGIIGLPTPFLGGDI